MPAKVGQCVVIVDLVQFVETEIDGFFKVVKGVFVFANYRQGTGQIKVGRRIFGIFLQPKLEGIGRIFVMPEPKLLNAVALVILNPGRGGIV